MNFNSAVSRQLSALFFILIFLPSCLGSSGSGDGVMAVAVYNATRPAGLAADAPLPEVLQVETFRVLVTGDDFEPVEVFFPSDADGGTISGLKKGDNRTVLVEAINKDGQVIRRRTITGVKIGGGKTTPIVASLLSVPIVTNLREGALVTQTRLVFKGYGEPASAIEVIDDSSGSSPLFDLSVNATIVSPSVSDGGFLFRPPLLPLGPHTFTIRDPETGEESRITLTLVPPGRQPGIVLGDMGRVQGSVTHSSNLFGTFPQVMEAMGR